MTIDVASPADLQDAALNYDDERGNSYLITHFVRGEGPTCGPTVHLVEVTNSGGVIPPHFHGEDQFQLVTRGDGQIGKTSLAPGTFHYVDGFTPYGPIEVGREGLTFFTVRPKQNTVTHLMPGSGHLRKRRTKRAGFVCNVDMDDPQNQVVSGPHEDGLATFRQTFKGGSSVKVAAPHESGGQVAFVLRGELIVDSKVYPQWSCVSVPAGEVFQARAGSGLLDLLLFQFGVQKSAN